MCDSPSVETPCTVGPCCPSTGVPVWTGGNSSSSAEANSLSYLDSRVPRLASTCTDCTSLFHTGGPSGKRRRVTSGGLDRRLSARMGVGALFAQHAACSAASTRPPRARALGMPAARLPTWPGRAWLAPARHRSGAPEARFALLALAPPAVPRESSTVRSRN